MDVEKIASSLTALPMKKCLATRALLMIPAVSGNEK